MGFYCVNIIYCEKGMFLVLWFLMVYCVYISFFDKKGLGVVLYIFKV